MDPTNWEKLVDLVRLEFRERVLPEELAWKAVALILKGVGKYCGIGLVEVIWKAVAMILNICFIATITYHDFLHGFRAGHGMGTATLKIKLLQQVAALREEVLHTIFLDLNKYYNALDRSRCLGILEGFDMGPRSLHLFRLY